jgi:hypothetical protein
MSELEADAKTLLSLLAADISVQMNSDQQRKLSIWATKTVMILEGTKPQTTRRFYRPEIRKAFKMDLAIPADTRIWMGRYSGSGLYGAAADMQFNVSGVTSPGYGNVATMIIGHLVLQVLSLAIPTETPDGIIRISQRADLWDSLLFLLWPYERPIMWPPARTFSDNPDHHPLTRLRDRWRVDATA